MLLRQVVVFIVFSLFAQFTIGQTNSYRTLKIKPTDILIDFDTLSVYPSSFGVLCRGVVIPPETYLLDFAKSTIQFYTIPNDSIEINYRVFPFDLSKPYKKRDTTILFNEIESDRERFLIKQTYTVDDVFGGSEINKLGSISRGVSFGNNQDLGINSSLNLRQSAFITGELIKYILITSDPNSSIDTCGSTKFPNFFENFCPFLSRIIPVHITFL